MRVADFIAQRLHYLGLRDVYMVTGGAAMHLNDAFSIKFNGCIHFLHHEQSCTMAAESHARITNKPVIVNVTAGPGAINAINGVFGAYVDSIPMIVVSGQAKRETLKINAGIKDLRQLGDQEVDITHMVSDVCKYSALIQDHLSIKSYVDCAYIMSTTGRPGPVWLDVPIDIQAKILPDEYKEYVNQPLSGSDHCSISPDPIATDQEIFEIAKHILTSRRPVLYVGNGIRISDSYEEFLNFLDEWPLATVTGWNSNDLLWDQHPCYCGRPGSVGNRAGNFAVQNSDCLITIGCRLNIRQVSFNWQSFAKNAWKCHIDIDRSELEKPTLSTDFKVHATIKGFFPRLAIALSMLSTSNKQLASTSLTARSPWINWLKKQLVVFSSVRDALPDQNKGINPYRFIQLLTSNLDDGSTIVCADGTACVVGFQAAIIKRNQRLFHNSGCASMGYELPGAIGAFKATRQPVICIAGDGSIMMNLQELAIVGGNNYPIGIYLLNNKGYHSIRQTQNNYFPNNPVGCGVESGLPFPDFENLCRGFGLKYFYSSQEADLDHNLSNSLEVSGPYLHEIILDLEQSFAPKLSSRKLADGSMVTSELDDMAPFLGQNELNQIRTEASRI